MPVDPNHPGLIKPPTDPGIPLRLVGRAHPPDESVAHSRNWSGDEGKYTVTIGLSRQATQDEQRALDDHGHGSMRMRIYGATLEISNTTLEEVRDTKDELQSLMPQIEQQGGTRQREREARAAEAEQRRQDEAKRLRGLADEIDFG